MNEDYENVAFLLIYKAKVAKFMKKSQFVKSRNTIQCS